MELLIAAAQVATATGQRALPEDEIGFTLLYRSEPDLEAERARIADLLGAQGFDLFDYGPSDPNQLILNFPGVPIQQSADYLFEQAEALRTALDLVAVQPELPPIFLPSEVGGPAERTEIFGALLSAGCRSLADPPLDPDWARIVMRVPQAEAKHGVTGRDIRVAQPDTGVADHQELVGAVRKDLGHNYLDGKRDPTDPLSRWMLAPGHGTKTASVVTSRASHTLTGSARGAQIVPLRVANAVVLTGGRATSLAVDHARLNNCHVVTMSLGTAIPFWNLGSAIERAVAADLIVMAAAGNCVGLVTYPAWHKDVIAVAAVDIDGNRWRGSCRGPAVDVSAPGENVHVATRKPRDGGNVTAIDDDGQGTSYAVALTAGVAALWLEKHGRSNVIAEARARGTVVQELFRSALKATADARPGWDSENMGAGIVDADALLSLDLQDIPPVEARGDAVILAGLTESALPLHLRAEAGAVAMDWHLRSSAEGLPMLETALPPQISPALATLLDTPPPAPLASPAFIAEPATPPEPLEVAFRRLATSDGSGRESAETLTGEAAIARIKQAGVEDITALAAEALDKRAAAEPDLVDTTLQSELLERADPVLRGVIDQDPETLAQPEETRAVLEALVRLTGRPAVRFKGGFEELDDPQLGSWRDDLGPIKSKWYPYVEAVGRIDVQTRDGAWMHVGTGLRLSDTQVITNRHVIDAFAQQLPTPDRSLRFKLPLRVAICFDPEPAPTSARYDLGPIETAGGLRIGKFTNLAALDLAIMTLQPPQDGHDAPTAPQRGIVGLDDEDITQLLVAGYPAQTTRPKAVEGEQSALWDRIEELYGDRYGVKYISPGYVMKRTGALADDPKGWTYSHDATTLGGNSGSPVLALNGAVRLAGLHFGGTSRTRNLAHDLVRVKAGADGVFDTGLLPDPA